MPSKGLTIIDKATFVAGISPSSRVFKQNQYAASVSCDPFRTLGVMQPGYYPTNTGSGIISGTITKWELGQGTDATDYEYVYGYDTAGCFYKVLQSTGVPSKVHTIGTYNGNANGMCQFTVNGVSWLMYTTNTDVGHSPAGWQTVDTGWIDNYWTSVLGQSALVTGIPHPMKKFPSAPATVFIGDKNTVRGITNTGGVATNTLSLPSNETIQKIEVLFPYLVVLTYEDTNNGYYGDSHVYFWDTASVSFSKRLDIKENQISDMINSGGILYMVLGTSKPYLAYYDNYYNIMKKLRTIPNMTVLPRVGCMSSRNGMIYIMGSQGSNTDIWTYDSYYPEIPPEINTPLQGGDAYSSTFAPGSIIAIDSNKIIGSSTIDSAAKLYFWNSNYNTGIFTSATIDEGIAEAKQWNNWKLFFQSSAGVNLATGESITFQYSAEGSTFNDFTDAAGSVASITRTSGTATVTTVAPHGLTTNEYAVIAGATQGDYNGTFQVTVTSPTVFTYTVANSPATPATGTITAARVSGRPSYSVNGAINSWNISSPVQGRDMQFRVIFNPSSGQATSPQLIRAQAEWEIVAYQ